MPSPVPRTDGEDAKLSTQKIKNHAYFDEILALNLPAIAFEAILEREPKERKKFAMWANEYENWLQFKPESCESHGDQSCRYFLKYLSKKEIKNGKKGYAPSSLWTISNYVKDYLNYKYNFPRKMYPLTDDFLKRKNRGYQPKKAEILTYFEYSQYWEDLKVEEDCRGLLIKCLMLAAYYAGDRSIETVYLEWQDVDIQEEKHGVVIRTVKVKGNRMPMMHVIPDTSRVSSVRIFKKYIKAVKETVMDIGPESRFWYHTDKGTGKFKGQNVGERFLTECTREIAKYHGKENWERFTSQGSRGASATTMLENRAPTKNILLHHNWQSEAVMDGYLRRSSVFLADNASFQSNGESLYDPKRAHPSDQEPPLKRFKTSENGGENMANSGVTFQGCTVNFVLSKDCSLSSMFGSVLPKEPPE
jgi:integrase